MFKKISRLLFCCLILLAAFFSRDALSDYIEGFDTTDANGYGLDSTFYFDGNNAVGNYYFNEYEGYFNYPFNEIKKVPKTQGVLRYAPSFNNCFVVKRNKDNTFSKIQILQQISGKRYLFRYGTNTTPNDSMLEKSDYDRSIRYKPNNLHEKLYYKLNYGYYGDTLFWEPPLPNNNNLIGYMLYKTKPGMIVDTTAPINLEQWDSSVALSIYQTKMPNFTNWLVPSSPAYFNIVAVYAEGKSDFLKGWTCWGGPVKVTNYSKVSKKAQRELEIKKTPTGYLVYPQAELEKNKSFSLFVFKTTGQQVACISNPVNTPIYWSTSKTNMSPGLYIIKAEFPDHTVLTQPFMFTK
jgi:hypothetical protein